MVEDGGIQQIRELIDERDLRYTQRFDSQQLATSDARTATETAISKSEATNLRKFEQIDAQLASLSGLGARVEGLAGVVDSNKELTDAKFVTFRTLVDSEAQKVQLALEASDKAISKKDLADEKRFEGVNEFRGQLSDQAATLLPRSEADVRLTSQSARIDELTNRLNRMVGHGDGETETRSVQARATALYVSIAVAVVSTIGLVVAIIVALT